MRGDTALGLALIAGAAVGGLLFLMWAVGSSGRMSQPARRRLELILAWIVCPAGILTLLYGTAEAAEAKDWDVAALRVAGAALLVHALFKLRRRRNDDAGTGTSR